MRKDLVIVVAVLVFLIAGGLVWASRHNVGEGAQATVFMTNAAQAGEGNECSVVYPLSRDVVATTSPEDGVRVAVEALFGGPSDTEAAQGYETSIPNGVQLNAVQVNEYGGVVTLDFTEEMQAGGSCRVAAIRNQIEATVAEAIAVWYPSTFSVVITVDGGNPDEALQP